MADTMSQEAEAVVMNRPVSRTIPVEQGLAPTTVDIMASTEGDGASTHRPAMMSDRASELPVIMSASKRSSIQLLEIDHQRASEAALRLMDENDSPYKNGGNKANSVRCMSPMLDENVF